MSADVVLEWDFSPSDYFEEAIEISRNDYTMTIADGHVQAVVDAAAYEAKPDMRQTIHDALNDRFLGVQLLTHRPFELSRSRVTRLHSDGRRDMYLEVEPGHLRLSGGIADLQLIDKDGNVIIDSKRDRIEKKKTLADLVAVHRATDETLASLVRSYNAAVRDPNNELVHLYEIREAIAVKFDGEREARAALGIDAAVWSRLGQLCNDEPLRQGRHRGKAGGALRDATDAELSDARRIARMMIELYLARLG